MNDERPRGLGFWLAAGVGVAMIAFGLGGLVHDRQAGHLIPWFAGAGLAHDAFIAPAAACVGWLTRYLPRPTRNPVRLGLAASVLLTVMTWPLVQGWGVSASNPSALPLDYVRNLFVVLAAIWLVAFGAAAVRLVRDRG